MRSRKTIAVAPGATIREQLEDRGMTQKEFSVRMDMSEKHISELINGKTQLTPGVALRLECVLGIPAQYWINLEAIYQEKCIRAKDENAMDNDMKLAQKFPYGEMAKLGWVENTRSQTERVVNLRKYFQVARLETIEKLTIPGIAYRRTDVNDRSNYALAAWAQRAQIEAREREVSSINIARLQELIPTIRAMTLEPTDVFCNKLVELLAGCGIAAVFLPHIKGSFLHGASFYDGKHIVLGLTVRGRDADKFWFSLFHELAHIIKGHIGKSGTTETEEKEANDFAAEVLIPKNLYDEFIMRNNISEAAVCRFAEQIGIAPGIVVGRLQNDGIIDHKHMNGLKDKYIID